MSCLVCAPLAVDLLLTFPCRKGILMRATTPALAVSGASVEAIRAVNRIRFTLEVNATIHSRSEDVIERCWRTLFEDLLRDCAFDFTTGEETQESKDAYKARLQLYDEHFTAVVKDLGRQLEVSAHGVTPVPGAAGPAAGDGSAGGAAAGGASAGASDGVDIDFSDTTYVGERGKKAVTKLTILTGDFTKKAGKAKTCKLSLSVPTTYRFCLLRCTCARAMQCTRRRFSRPTSKEVSAGAVSGDGRCYTWGLLCSSGIGAWHWGAFAVLHRRAGRVDESRGADEAQE
jgi:hypothetical protein